jgi:hypothetical protein
MALTWAEDRATLASDPSAVPGANTEWAGIVPAFSHSGLAPGAQRTGTASFACSCLSPWRATAVGCTRLFELRHLSPDEPIVPAHFSVYDAPLIRSDILPEALTPWGIGEAAS